MSIGLMPYRADLAAIQQFTGGGGDTVEKIIEQQAEEIGHLNCQLLDIADEGSPTLEEAMRQIARGDIPEDNAYMHACAVEQLCGFYGRMLVNDQWCPTKFRVVRELDEQLRAAGVTEALPDDLCTWKPPIPIPRTFDFPMISTVDTATCERAAKQYARAIPTLAESEWRSAGVQVASWLRQCRDRGEALVVFCY
jgi:hypothetical protein